MALTSINPATEEQIATYEEFTTEQTEAALAQAAAALAAWRETSFSRRGELVAVLAAALRRRKQELAGLITAEMGKPIAESEAEIEKAAWGCEYFAQNGERFLSNQTIATNASSSYVAFDPLGVILAIMPWNFPVWQVLRFLAPALMAGNTAVLKHASNVTGCALALEDLVRECGFPEGALRTLVLAGARAEKLVDDPRIRAITLTGSDSAGSAIGAASGRAIKKTVLELGGSDPYIVLADADVAQAARVAVRARNQNSGQSCIAAKRFIVVDAVADQFAQLFSEGAAALRVGDPLDRQTLVGPLARGDLRGALQKQVDASVALGAQVLTGGAPLEGRGYFYAPTVLDYVTSEMPVFREETFGPVAAIIRARDEEEALALANDSPYGLGSNLWSADVEKARRLARRVEAGAVFINGMVASDPRLPFGGVKRSGYGRELSGFGIHEFVNVKTIWIGPSVDAQPVSRPAE